MGIHLPGSEKGQGGLRLTSGFLPNIFHRPGGFFHAQALLYLPTGVTPKEC